MTISPVTSHFCPISSQGFANWLRKNVPDKLWSIDGEDDLSAHLDFPCPTEDLAAALHNVHRDLQAQVYEYIENLDEDNLDKAILHFPRSPGEPEELVSFLLYWNGQSPEDAWTLSENPIEEN